MFIEEIKIHNFRGLEVEICNLNKNFLIIGKNDSGKTSVCKAIRKVLDYNIRRIPFTECDSTNYNRQDISITLIINLENITDINRNRLGKLVDFIDEKYMLKIQLYCKFNSDILMYEEEMRVGFEDIIIYQTNKYTPVDKVLDLIYINPSYDIERNKKDFFVNRQQKSIENVETIMPLVKNSVEDLNKTIQGETSITNLIAEINVQDGFSKIFDDVEFQIKSNIDISNIYKSLEIFPYIKGTDEQINIGDGKSKTLSMLLQKNTYINDKQKFFIIEEPENHLYPLLQQYYIGLTTTFGFDQMIYTSHSPYIIDFSKTGQIVKLIVSNKDKLRNVTCKTLNVSSDDFKTFGYLQDCELAEMMFYDKVLLIEGYSEKYFYNLLKISDKKFRDYIVDNNIGIFSVYGIDFGPAKRFLETIGIKVIIKTDNDLFKVPNKNEKRYAGIERVFNCLDDIGVEKLEEILEVKITNETFRCAIGCEKNNLIANKMFEIVKLFKEYGVYLSVHSDGFEGDFLEFVGRKDTYEKDKQFLIESKLKNLHSFIIENKIDISITESNKNNVLVEFMNEKSK